MSTGRIWGNLDSGINRATKMFKGPDANSNQLHTERQDFLALLLQAYSTNSTECKLV